MLTGTIRNQIDQLWEKFWTGGITNPLTVIEQISYLMFARMLDMEESKAEKKAKRTRNKKGLLYPQTPEGQLLRWSQFEHLSGADLHKHVKDKVFPFFAELGQLAQDNPNLKRFGHLAEYMQGADLDIKNESVLASAVSMVNELPLTNSDVKGDIYEYLLSKLTTAGINGQFRTPRHIIDAMIEMAEPQPTETVYDPSCGTAGFLARTMEYLTRVHTSPAGKLKDEEGNIVYSGDLLSEYRPHIEKDMFWGMEFDSTMLRVGSMNMLLHGVTQANIVYQDTLNKNIKTHFPKQEKDFFDVVLGNPPFKGSIDSSNTNPDVLKIVDTKKTELLFVGHILNCLKLGGRAAVIVPDGVLFGSSKAHQKLRKTLVEENQLEGVVSLPSGVFKPYAGVSTAILFFTKGGGTERVWFYDVKADGYSLDDKRTPLSGEGTNDLPDVIQQWKQYRGLIERNAKAAAYEKAFGDKTQAAFVVDKADIAANKYDLSINRYKEVVYEEEVYDPPKVILQQLKDLEQDIMEDLARLEKML